MEEFEKWVIEPFYIGISGLRHDSTGRIMKEVYFAENEVVKTVLTKYLGHSPLPADFSKLTKESFEGNPLDYHLLYNGIHLGYIQFTFGEKAGISFTPAVVYK